MIIQTLARLLHSLNPRLLQSPPPEVETTGNDICYLGPNGEDDSDKVIFCRDLQEGMRSWVGSWYLQPERHVMESIVFTIASFLVIIYLQHEDNDIKSAKRRKPPSILMKLITLFIFTSQLYYKGRQKFLEMLAPCMILWCLAMVLHFYPNLSTSKFQCIIQLFITWIGLPIAAIAKPDTSNCTAFGEAAMFYVHHSILIFMPVYYVLTERVSAVAGSDDVGGSLQILVSFNTRYWLMGSALKCIFYFSIVSLINVWSGKNINYMMSPPPGDMVSGDNFRLFTILYLGILFMAGRGLVVALELLLKGTRNDNGQVTPLKVA